MCSMSPAGFLDEEDAAALAEAERAGPQSNLSPAMAAAHSTHAFKKVAIAAVKEFCDSEDYDEVARILSVRTCSHPNECQFSVVATREKYDVFETFFMFQM